MAMHDLTIDGHRYKVQRAGRGVTVGKVPDPVDPRWLVAYDEVGRIVTYARTRGECVGRLRKILARR